MTWLAELYVAHPFWIWMALAAVLLAAEVATTTGWLLWPAACAVVVAALTFLLGGNFAVELAVFAMLTIASTLLARRYLPRNLSGDGPDINDNIGRLVGHSGMVVAAFENGQGRVFIDGKEWAAVTEDGSAPMLEQKVEVISAAGGILKVKAA
ncbi:COG1585 Membrane protein implicated in regulation of membrane protease activity [Caulobacteraceae bacterium]|jgi:membrane protein implicated in regulation of membrane protease activity